MDRAILELVWTGGAAGLPLYVLCTLLVAAALSFVLGLERELHGEPTGLGTHVLISLSCSLLMTVSLWAMRLGEGDLSLLGPVKYDTSRIAASIVSGVGFLGAGTIIKNGPNVRGLSTAATLWVSSAIGMACGAGMLAEAAVTTAVTMLVLLLSARVKKRIDSRLPCLTVVVRGEGAIVSAIIRQSSANGMIIRDILSGEIAEDALAIEIKVLFAYKTAPVLILDLARCLLREENIMYVEFNGIRLP